jgi:Transposase domain (DUF772)
LDYLWFLGYQLDDPIPNHSVLSKTRKRQSRVLTDLHLLERKITEMRPVEFGEA